MLTNQTQSDAEVFRSPQKRHQDIGQFFAIQEELKKKQKKKKTLEDSESASSSQVHLQQVSQCLHVDL